jgi:hypothetical protein
MQGARPVGPAAGWQALAKRRGPRSAAPVTRLRATGAHATSTNQSGARRSARTGQHSRCMSSWAQPVRHTRRPTARPGHSQSWAPAASAQASPCPEPDGGAAGTRSVRTRGYGPGFRLHAGGSRLRASASRRLGAAGRHARVSADVRARAAALTPPSRAASARGASRRARTLQRVGRP